MSFACCPASSSEGPRSSRSEDQWWGRTITQVHLQLPLLGFESPEKVIRALKLESTNGDFNTLLELLPELRVANAFYLIHWRWFPEEQR